MAMLNESRDDPPIEARRGRGCHCRRCHYPLQGLPSPGDCPECGKPFDLDDWSTYTYDERPRTLRQRILSSRVLSFLVWLLVATTGALLIRWDACMTVILSPVITVMHVTLVFTWSGFKGESHSLSTWMLIGSMLGTLSGAAMTCHFGVIGLLSSFVCMLVGLYVGLMHGMLDDGI